MALDLHTFHVDQAPWADRGPQLTVPAERLQVRVTARFRDGYVADVLGWTTAWTPTAVWCVFAHPDPRVESGLYRLWIPVADVSRDVEDLCAAEQVRRAAALLLPTRATYDDDRDAHDQGRGDRSR